jgi:hypothetical protein
MATTAIVLASATSGTDPGDNFKKVQTALENLEKTEKVYKKTKESEIEKLVLTLAGLFQSAAPGQGQTTAAFDPGPLIAWHDSYVAAEAKRTQALAAFTLAEDELREQRKDYIESYPTVLLPIVDAMLEDLDHQEVDVEGHEAVIRKEKKALGELRKEMQRELHKGSKDKKGAAGTPSPATPTNP